MNQDISLMTDEEIEEYFRELEEQIEENRHVDEQALKDFNLRLYESGLRLS